MIFHGILAGNVILHKVSFTLNNEKERYIFQVKELWMYGKVLNHEKDKFTADYVSYMVQHRADVDFFSNLMWDSKLPGFFSFSELRTTDTIFKVQIVILVVASGPKP